MREYIYVRFANAVLVGPSVDPLVSLSAGQSGTGFCDVSFGPDPDMPALFLRITSKLPRGNGPDWVQLVPWAQVTSISFKDSEAPAAAPVPENKAPTSAVTNPKTSRKGKAVA